MNKEELQKKANEIKERISKIDEDDLENATGGVTYVNAYQEGCDSFLQNIIIGGKTPKQCAYCMFAYPAPDAVGRYICFKDRIDKAINK